MQSQRVFFQNARAVRLAGMIDEPHKAARAYAVFAHCFTCNKQYKFIRRICQVLADRAIAVLRFDFTGLGESGGNFADTNFTTNVEDVIAAARFLSAEHGAPWLLIGHSLGGTAVLTAAPQLPDVRAVATINSPFEPRHLYDCFSAERARIEREGSVEVEIGGQPVPITGQLLDDLRDARTAEAIGRLNAALLILHAPGDRTVGIANAGRIFETASHPKSFIALDAADHLLSQERDARYCGELIATWATRYFDAEAGEP